MEMRDWNNLFGGIMGKSVFRSFILAFATFFTFLPIFPIHDSQAAEEAPAAPTTNSAPKKDGTAPKQGGIMGDPARKRGLELGFDYGLKAGKADKEQNKKPDPKSHSEFNDPNKLYRYEYGYRASFNAGFRSGFMGGYQQAFGKDVKMVHTGESSPSPQSHVPKATKAATPAAKPKASNISTDAL